MSRLIPLWLLLSAWSTNALAQEQAERSTTSAQASADRGELSPFSSAPFVRGRVATGRGGYDSAAGRADVQAEASAAVTSWLGIRAGASYSGLSDATRPYALGLVSLLEEKEAGLGLGAHGGFEARGFNTVPNAVVGFSASKHLGSVLILTGFSYGQALSSSERNGRAQFGASQRIAPYLRWGVDSRGEIDLERDADEPAEEPDFRVRGGPFATLTLGAFALTAGGGLSALRYRLAPASSVGGMGYAALGAAF